MSDNPSTAIPSHVPNDLVFDFDLYGSPTGAREHVQREMARMLHRDAPDIFYTPRNGGHWVATRVADVVELFRDTETFSSDPAYNHNRNIYPRFAPLEYDPPLHTDMRRVVNPFFTPGAVQKMMHGVRGEARALIDAVAPKGGCEFVDEIAQRFPVNIFLRMCDAPLADRTSLLQFASGYLRNPILAERAKGRAGIANYLKGMLERRSKNPGDDLISMIATSRLPERDLTEDEKIGFGTFMFFAGLDTVMAMLTHIFNFLGRHPDHYRALVTDRDSIPNRLEELIRTHGVNATERALTTDTLFKGIQFKKLDRIVVMFQIMGYDGNETAESDIVDFGREISRHISFGAGLHRCLGSHLARVEMRTFLEEWTQSIPAFTVAEIGPIKGGNVWMPDVLHLKWAT